MLTNNKIAYDPVEVDADYFAENESAGENFYSYIKTLPTGILNILFGLDTPDILEKISLGYGLSSLQAASLSRLIRQVLIGEIYIGDFPTQISSALKLDQTKAKELASAVATQLFQSELEDIKKVQATKFPDRVAQKQAVPPIPPQLRQNFVPQNLGGQAQKYPGEDLPETGGNIIDLRNQK